LLILLVWKNRIFNSAFRKLSKFSFEKTKLFKREVINQLYDDKEYYLEDKFSDFIDSLDEVTKKKFRRFLNERKNDGVEDKIKHQIKLMLYNKREIPLATRNKLEGIQKNNLQISSWFVTYQ